MLLKVLLLVCCCQLASALNCYTCSVGEQDAIRDCVDEPEKTVVTDCNKKYCVVTRIEYKEYRDKVASIYRGCEDKPHMNEIVEDATYRTYYSACQEDLCNGGSGKGGDTGNPGSLGSKETLIVPGIGNNRAANIVVGVGVGFVVLVGWLLA